MRELDRGQAETAGDAVGVGDRSESDGGWLLAADELAHARAQGMNGLGAEPPDFPGINTGPGERGASAFKAEDSRLTARGTEVHIVVGVMRGLDTGGRWR
jgi:hypothetical protein